MPLIELQVHALDEQLRWPEPFRRFGGSARRSNIRFAMSAARLARAQLRAQPRARQKDAKRVALECAETLDAVDRRSCSRGSAG